jgi:hypothetical protein
MLAVSFVPPLGLNILLSVGIEVDECLVIGISTALKNSRQRLA